MLSFRNSFFLSQNSEIPIVFSYIPRKDLDFLSPFYYGISSDFPKVILFWPAYF